MTARPPFAAVTPPRAPAASRPGSPRRRASWPATIGTRPATVATFFVLLVCLSIGGIETWRAMAAHRAQIQESQAATLNLAKSMAEHASGVFLQADALLSGIAERLETDGTDAASIARIHRLLDTRSTPVTQVRRVAVIDANGRRLTTSADAPDSGLDLRDREYFRYHLTHPDNAPHLGPPVRGDASGRWVLTVSRRFDDRQGAFAGVVVAAIDLTYFSDFYQQFDLGENGSILFAMSNGTVLDRRPFSEDLIGASIADGPLFARHIAFDEAGTAWITSTIDGVERLSGYQRLSVFPAYTIVSFSKEQILRSWVEDTLVHACVAAALIVTLGLLGRMLVRQIAEHHRDQVALIESRDELETLNTQLDALARIDGLTGLPNRREFDRVIAEEARRLDRNRGSLALIMLDIDQFKNYNDYFGHPQGDECLRIVAGLIRQCVSRPGDVAARYGGEEFVVLLPSTDAEGAWAVAEKLRLSFHQRAMPQAHGAGRIVTASLGISVMRAEDGTQSIETLLVQADKALYAAKQSGRDAIRRFNGTARIDRYSTDVPREVTPVAAG